MIPSVPAVLPDNPETSWRGVVHDLITAHASMVARQQAEIAPFKGPDGALLGEDYDDHDEAADRHVEEQAQMLGIVIAVLAREFGRPHKGTTQEADALAGMSAVLATMTDPDLEGGDIVEAIKERLQALGFDLNMPDDFDEGA
ncbi:hypothetical protein [Embleya sp. MST-111070]|uniref:hypothetical protein n=1 Tax=Embleya sp. MST-111070 TaxID=3398231 RepID=UPI003F73BC0A